jgi:formylglycine-generating enzyme required for sulfatase activity
MAGNVWEWTSDYFAPQHAVADPGEHGDGGCCVPHNPQVTSPALAEAIPRRVIKGGSHLCAPSYCLRYRPAARQGEAVDTATTHIGFRCILRDTPPGGRGDGERGAHGRGDR